MLLLFVSFYLSIVDMDNIADHDLRLVYIDFDFDFVFVHVQVRVIVIVIVGPGCGCGWGNNSWQLEMVSETKKQIKNVETIHYQLIVHHETNHDHEFEFDQLNVY
jgi:hypothetical protein